MEFGRLMVDLKTYGFENEPIIHEVMKDSIERIDSYTYKYKNQEVWFENIKVKILTEIKRKRIQSAQFLPNDIELLKVYILKEEIKDMRVSVQQKYDFLNISVWEKSKIETEKRPLFKEIQVREQVVLLEDVVKNRMFYGNLVLFYHITCELGDSDYFFQLVPFNLQKKILNSLDENTVHQIYAYLSRHERFMALIRLLLLYPASFEKMKAEYLRIFGNDKEKSYEETDYSLERIRMPYKED